MPGDSMTRLLLIRHGQTESNVCRCWQGVREDPLTVHGRAEARRLGAWLARHDRPDVLYASPLPRARETAELIGAAVHLPLTLDPRLREMDFGACSGLTWVQIAEQLPNLPLVRQPWREAYDPAAPDWCWPDGDWNRPYHRGIQAAVAEIVRRHPSTTIGVVTHGGFILGALAWLLHGITGRAHREYPIANASVTEVCYHASACSVVRVGVQPWLLHDDRGAGCGTGIASDDVIGGSCAL